MTFIRKNSKVAIIIGTLLFLIIVLALWTFAEDTIMYTKMQTGYISPSDISINGTTAYVSDSTSNKIYSINLTNNTVAGVKYESAQPVNSVYSKGSYVYALTGGLDGNLVRLNASTLVLDKTVETGHTPSDILIINNKIYVSCRYTNDVWIYNESDLTFINKITVTREPMAMTAAGSDIYVAGHLNDGEATTVTAADSEINIAGHLDETNADVVSASVSVISSTTDTLTNTIKLPNGCGGVKDICTSEAGDYVYVTSVIERYTYPVTQMDRGWINTNGITIINVSNKSVLTTVMLDNLEEGAANPWGIECSGTQLIITISGTNELMIVDTTEMLKQINYVKTGNSSKKVESMDDIPNYLPFMDSSKVRLPVDGAVGLRRLAISNGKAYICGYFTGNITVLDIANKNTSTKISLGSQPENDAVRKGEIAWNNANLCYQKWQSCASCHPDGRVDGINWDNTNDGMGNPKNVISGVYAHRTPPSLTTGIRANAELVVEKSLNFSLIGVIRNNEDHSINEYLKSLSPIPSPYLNRDGTLTADALEGKILFESEGCIKCHYGPNFTDLDKHRSSSDVTYSQSWENRDFYTSRLVETWATGPWFASGQYKTLKEAVTASLPSDSTLNSAQIDKLTAYVGSIGNNDEYYGVEQVKITSDDNSLVYNTIKPGQKIIEMTVRKQLATTARAKVSLTLYAKNGSQITSKSFTLDAMEINEYATIPLSIDIASDIEIGSYYIVSIVDAGNNSVKLATDFTIYYK